MRGDGFALDDEHVQAIELARDGSRRCGSPGRDGGGRTLTRVGFLGSGLVAAAGALGGYAAQASAAESLQVWGLDPYRGGDPGTCGCASCAACVAHAANKLFASAAAADAGRAHLHCRCLVAPLERVPESVYSELFSEAGGRSSVDRRHQWVQAVFAHDAVAEQPVVIQPAAEATAVRTAAPPLQVVLGRVRFRRAAGGQRFLYADIEVDRAVTATIALTRQGPTVARRIVPGVNGKHRLRLPVPMRAKAGPARLRVRVRDADGRARTVTRGVHLPHP